ncbi:MAG: hypothetical protein AAB802_03260 [Patescibacteria group bacterium]
MGKFKEGDIAYLYTGEDPEDSFEIVEVEILEDLRPLAGLGKFRIRVLEVLQAHPFWVAPEIESESILNHVIEENSYRELLTPEQHAREFAIKALEADLIGANKEGKGIRKTAA